MSEKWKRGKPKPGANLNLEPVNSLREGWECNGNRSAGNKISECEKQDRKVKKSKRRERQKHVERERETENI